jgi:hypothetical protein
MLVAAACCCSARAAESTYRVQSGEATEADGQLTAKTKAVVDFAFAAPFDAMTIRGVTGKEKVWAGNTRVSVGIEFLDKDGKVVNGNNGKPLPPYALWANDYNAQFPDGCIQLPWPARYCIRPNIGFLNAAEQKKLAAVWSTLPSASQHEFKLEYRYVGSAFQIWFDDNLMSEVEAPTGVAGCRITLAPGASLREVSAAPRTSSSSVVLPVQEYSRVQEMAGAKLAFDDKAQLPEEFKKLDGPETKGIALAMLGRFPGLRSDDLQSFYWRRHASDSLLEQRMFSVPLATYDRAEVLCALDDDPAKVNSFTLRVTRYGNSRGNAMADTIVTVPRDETAANANARRVGTVSYGSAQVRKKATLWLVTVPIKNGLIQDLLYNDDHKNQNTGTARYLDVELLGGPLANVAVADAFPPPMEVTGRSWAGLPQTSGVHVFGVALQKSPAVMQVRSNIGVQAFYASDKPQFEAVVRAERAGEYSVRWDYADMDGKAAGSGARAIKLDAGGEGKIVASVTPGVGWYAARFRLEDAAGHELVDYRTSFVMLPPDTRQAGLESPFYGWWFGANHGSDIKLDEIGPLLKRLGIRRVGLGEGMPESETLPQYGFTESTVPWTSKFYGELYGGKTDMAGAIAQHEALIRKYVEQWPHIDRMLVFHESGSTTNVFPSEIVGVAPPPLKPDVAERMKFRIDYLTALAKMMREKFPQIKLQYGNDGNSLRIVGELLRAGFPREYIDTISSEDLGQTMIPERMMIGGTQDGFYLRTMAEKMGYGDVPVTACTEWIGRMTEKLGLRTQAEWKVRDGLLALAYGYDTISIAGINDAGDGYYYSIWANGGLTGRYPIMAPKPAYAAVATLTRVLDRAQFQRFVPTGSTVCYLEEFRRGNEWVYALWTPRGERAVTLNFPDAAQRTLTDLYGHESGANGKVVTLDAGTAPRYLTSPTQLASCALGASTFPRDKANVPPQPQQVIPLESTGAIALVADSYRADRTANAIWEKQLMGQFEIRNVDDPEMGQCVEVELKPEGELRLGDVEYLTLQLKQPVATTAKNAGVWIKGNGSWGEVDLMGSALPWRDNHDLDLRWRGDLTMNFDGWNFLKFPTAGKDGDKPGSVTGFRITLPRATLVGTEMKPVPVLKFRLKSIVLF